MQTEQTNVVKQFKKLPVTVLSGFLGSGKTTLLKHILENKQNLRCALIVNDMAELNIDSALIKDAQLVQSEEKMISMQNGCICCTLREDLLIEVQRLAKMGEFDYLVIESTGISEPMQVAETFSFDIPQENEDGTKNEDVEFLKDYATLDTCVTVVDSYNFFNFFNTQENLSEKFPEENPSKEDERTVTELMVDQLEFANVIILNKTDLVTKVQLAKVKQMAQKLNPDAQIITTTHAKVDLTKIINTGIFDLEKAKENKDWLSQDRYNFVPETQEYGITSFVYKQKVPFHNLRIYEYLSQNFYVDFDPRHVPEEDFQLDENDAKDLEITKQGEKKEIKQDQEQKENPEETKQEEEQEKKEDPHKGHNHRHPKKRTENMKDEEEDEEIEEEEGDWEDDEEDNDEENEVKVDREAQKYKRLRNLAFKQKKQGNMKNVWRSKGFFWIAGNKKEFYAWQQAGIINQVFCGGIYGCMLDEKTVAQIPKEEYAEIQKQMDPVIGDRQTSIVFIGKDLDEKRIRKDLDSCLLTKKEFQNFKDNDLELTFKEDPFFYEEEEEMEEEEEDQDAIEQE